MGEHKGRPRSWSDNDLRRAASSSTSLKEVALKLGLKQSGKTNHILRAHAERLDIDLSLDGRKVRVDLEGDIDQATRFLVEYAPERLDPKWRTYFEDEDD